jgi:broad specificity phosphatase PhoE
LKYFVLLRHAHRDASEHDRNNGLSSKGLAQVADLLHDPVIRKVLEGQRDMAFLSSPKKRCVQTIEPLASLAQVKLQISEDLDEQHSEESQSMFLKRVDSFYTEMERSTHLVMVVCSHGDWIPAFTARLDIDGFARGAQIDLRKGHYLALEYQGDAKWKVMNK